MRTGYIQRRLIKAMEGLSIAYDSTIRNSNNQMIQLRYGEDGMDGGAIEFQNIATMRPSTVAFEKKFHFDLANERRLRRYFQEDIVRELSGSANALQEVESEFTMLQDDRDLLRRIFPTGNARVALPVNLSRLIWNAQKTFRINSRSATDLHPLRVVEGLCNHLYGGHCDSHGNGC